MRAPGDSVASRLLEPGFGDLDARVITEVDGDGSDVTAHSRRTLATAGRRVAGGLQAAGVCRGDAVLLVHPSSSGFVEALVGCLLAGAVAVPVAPPDPLSPTDAVDRLHRVARAAGARVGLLAPAFGWVRELGAGLSWASAGDPADPVDVDPNDVAVVQFTSGSTGAPRGVRLTHANLLAQVDATADALGIDADSRLVMWLPHHHDFGLVSGLVSAMVGHGRLHFVAPQAFLRRPAVWLDLLTRAQATHTASPDFGYDLVVRRTASAPRSRWDLSALRVAMSAAERVRDETMQAFTAAFRGSGFSAEAWCPAYGLAEHTVGVSVGGRSVRRVEGRVLRGCGPPLPGVDVRIVDPDSLRVLPEGDTGEIWVASTMVAAGYIGADDAAFHAATPDVPGHTYLRTGDLGFLADGEIFPVGRLKDVVVVRGAKLHPEDLEVIVRPDLRVVAVFGVPGPASVGERVVLLAEVTEEGLDAARLIELARSRVRAAARVALHEVVLGGRGLVRRTTSGKVSRSACRRAYLAGELGPVLARWRSSSPLDDSVAFEVEAAESADRAHVAELLALWPTLPTLPAVAAREGVCRALRLAVARAASVDVASVTGSTPLRALGLDSATAVDLASAISQATGQPDIERLLVGGKAHDLDGLTDAILAVT